MNLSTFFLRLASLIAFLLFLGHSMGAPWTPDIHEAATTALTALHAPSVSQTRTYWDFYFGFGLSISIYLLMLSLLLWQSATLVKITPTKTLPLLATLALGYCAAAFIAYKYFFLVPAILASTTVVLIVIAIAAVRRRPGENIDPTATKI